METKVGFISSNPTWTQTNQIIFSFCCNAWNKDVTSFFKFVTWFITTISHKWHNSICPTCQVVITNRMPNLNGWGTIIVEIQSSSVCKTFAQYLNDRCSFFSTYPQTFYLYICSLSFLQSNYKAEHLKTKGLGLTWRNHLNLTWDKLKHLNIDYVTFTNMSNRTIFKALKKLTYYLIFVEDVTIASYHPSIEYSDLKASSQTTGSIPFGEIHLTSKLWNYTSLE